MHATEFHARRVNVASKVRSEQEPAVKIHPLLNAIAFISLPLISAAQQPAQTQLKIDSSNRTIAATADDTVSIEPDLAILHIGFDTALQDAKSAYADGARISNAIIAAVKQAGVA